MNQGFQVSKNYCDTLSYFTPWSKTFNCAASDSDGGAARGMPHALLSPRTVRKLKHRFEKPFSLAPLSLSWPISARQVTLEATGDEPHFPALSGQDIRKVMTSLIHGSFDWATLIINHQHMSMNG
jgi:hypothetical protein